MNWKMWVRQIHRWLVHRLYGDRHRQLRRPGAGRWDAAALGDLLAAAPARPAPAHRVIHVRAAVCHQVAQRATHRLNEAAMPLLGPAAMLLCFDVDAEAIPEHDRWHTHEHLPERLSIPGFRRGTRWVAREGMPRYMVLYEVESLQTLLSESYVERLNNPTPWTTRIMPHYRGMTRGLCVVLGSFGYGQGDIAALIRFTPEEPSAQQLQRWLLTEVLPGTSRMSGLGSAHLLQQVEAAAMTHEQSIRGADRDVDSALIIMGYDGNAVAACARELCAAGALPSRGARAITRATYGFSYSLARAEIEA